MSTHNGARAAARPQTVRQKSVPALIKNGPFPIGLPFFLLGAGVLIALRLH